MTLVGAPEFCGNFAGSDVALSIVARTLAKRVVGVTIDPNPTCGPMERKIQGGFDLLADSQARPLVARVLHSPEVTFLYDMGAYSTGGHFLYEREKHLNSPLIPDAAKRLEVAELRRSAIWERQTADSLFKRDPVKAVRHDVRAIVAKRQAQWVSEELLPIADIASQVIDRERAFLAEGSTGVN